MEQNQGDQIDAFEIEAAEENAKRLMKGYGFEKSADLNDEYDELANMLKLAFLDGVFWQKERTN